MSSLTRSIRKRALKKGNVSKLPIISDRGFLIGRRWPLHKGDLAYTERNEPIRVDTQHPTLQPVIDILVADYVRRQATPAAA